MASRYCFIFVIMIAAGTVLWTATVQQQMPAAEISGTVHRLMDQVSY